MHVFDLKLLIMRDSIRSCTKIAVSANQEMSSVAGNMASVVSGGCVGAMSFVIRCCR